MTTTDATDTTVLPEGFDFTDPDTNQAAIPHEEFARLRRSSPIHWVPQAPGTHDGMAEESGHGYWAITRHMGTVRSYLRATSFPPL